MAVPRSCLGRPRWVKAGAIAARIPADNAVAEPARASRKAREIGPTNLARLARAASTPSLSQPSVFEVFIDNALSRSGAEDLTYGPRLRRG